MRLVLLLALAAGAVAVTTRWHQLEAVKYDFAQYQTEFNKHYDADELPMRKQLFEERLANIIAHNRRHHSWKAGVNHLTDRTAAELKSIRGYDKVKAMHARAAGHHAHRAFKSERPASLPSEVDWRLKKAVTPVKDQGGCGSCWTFAAAETIESAWFLAGNQMVELSEQQIASCSPNPHNCGGTGGCEGGTAEVAFQGVIDAGGISSEWVYPYVSHDGTDFPCKNITQAAAKIKSYTTLPTNKYSALLEAVALRGPIAISVDASIWSMYESGIFDSCNMASPVIDHAVQAVGYGSDNGQLYWLVRNSWTPTWGENGYIRVKRQPDPQVCGVDTDPGSGTGCTPGPANMTVCGECGILSDSSYPTV